MTSSTRFRFAALAAAATVVAAGFFAAAPANAATGTISLANTTFTAGSCGTGLDVTGTGFTPDAVVTVAVAASNGSVPIDVHTVTADDTGAFHEVYTPAAALALPAAGVKIGIGAISDKGDTSNIVPFTVLAPKGISSSTPTITTADLIDDNHGVSVAAAGYQPGESVKVTVDYDGEKLTLGTYTVAADGSVAFGFVLAGGVATAGTMVVTVAGQTSGVSQSVDITVTGPDVNVGGGAVKVPSVAGGPIAPAPAAAPSQTKKLPVVSG